MRIGLEAIGTIPSTRRKKLPGEVSVMPTAWYVFNCDVRAHFSQLKFALIKLMARKSFVHRLLHAMVCSGGHKCNFTCGDNSRLEGEVKSVVITTPIRESGQDGLTGWTKQFIQQITSKFMAMYEHSFDPADIDPDCMVSSAKAVPTMGGRGKGTKRSSCQYCGCDHLW